MYSLVNLKDISLIAPYHTELFPEGLTFASNNELIIGTIDEVQKLHIQTFTCDLHKRSDEIGMSSSTGISATSGILSNRAQIRRVEYWPNYHYFAVSLTDLPDASDPYQSVIAIYSESVYIIIYYYSFSFISYHLSYSFLSYSSHFFIYLFIYYY